MCSLIDILQWKENNKDSDDFWHRKLTLKSNGTFWHLQKSYKKACLFICYCFVLKTIKKKFTYVQLFSKSWKFCKIINYLTNQSNFDMNFQHFRAQIVELVYHVQIVTQILPLYGEGTIKGNLFVMPVACISNFIM